MNLEFGFNRVTGAALAEPVLDISDLSISYGGGLPAVQGVNLIVRPGEVVGVIGESGSGKTSLAHAILRLLPQTAAITGKRLSLCGTDLLDASGKTLASLRGPGAAMIFQNPMTAFSPSTLR